MLPEDILDLLEKVVALGGQVVIEYVRSTQAPSWSCDLNVGRGGHGTGDSALEAIDDALDDFGAR